MATTHAGQQIDCRTVLRNGSRIVAERSLGVGDGYAGLHEQNSLPVTSIAKEVERNLRDDPDYGRTWGSMTPMNRAAEPEEMVGPTVFLASRASSFVTGLDLIVDGGYVCW